MSSKMLWFAVAVASALSIAALVTSAVAMKRASDAENEACVKAYQRMVAELAQEMQPVCRDFGLAMPEHAGSLREVLRPFLSVGNRVTSAPSGAAVDGGAAAANSRPVPASSTAETVGESPQAVVDMLVPVGETELPVANVWIQSHSRDARREGLVIAVWRNGRVLWSADSLAGGPPFYEGRIPASKVDAILVAARRQGYFRDLALCRGHFGPDARYTTISITDGEGRLQMDSWHELYEANSDLVATAHGLASLEGRDRTAVLAAQPAEYRRYRRVWTDIRTSLQAIIPTERRPAGDLQFTEVSVDAAGQGVRSNPANTK